MKLSGKAVISHFTFHPPLIAASDLENEACFIFPINTEGKLYRVHDKTHVQKDQGVLMKCGTYINKWYGLDPSKVAEVLILRLSPEVMKDALDLQIGGKVRERLDSKRTTALVKIDVLLHRFLEGLLFYFDHPELVNDELVVLKIKELTLLLLNAKDSNPIIELLTTLFNRDTYTIKEVINTHLFENLSIQNFAQLCNLSVSSFNRKFKKAFKTTPSQYIKTKRLEKAAHLLLHTDEPVSHIGYTCGFNDPTYFTKAFKSMYMQSPSSYRQQNHRE